MDAAFLDKLNDQQRYYQKKQAMGDRHTSAQPSRFLPDGILHHFERVSLEPAKRADGASGAQPATEIRRKIAAMWR